MKRGMTLVFSLWDDHDVGMIWLDAVDPFPIPAGKSGAPRGTCSQDSGDPDKIENEHPHAYVIYKDIRYGEIGSTLADPLPGPSPPKPPAQCGHYSTYGVGLAKANAIRNKQACRDGSLKGCIDTCPTAPPSTYQGCVKACFAKCAKVDNVAA